MKMKRRTFMGTSTAALAIPAIAKAQNTSLKLSHYLPPQHQTSLELMRWADEVRELSGGAADIEVFPAGQMGPPPRQYDLARTGVADISFVFTALNPGRFPLIDAYSLPFLFADEEGNGLSTSDASFIGTSLQGMVAEEFPGTQPLYSIIASSASGFFMRDRLIEAPEDLQGLRVRPTSAAAAAQLTALGASPATIPPTELANAIDRGVVDGAVFNFEAAQVFQLHQSVTKASTLANLVGYFALVMNSESLAALPPEGRMAIEETTGPEAARRIGAHYDEAGVTGRAFLEAEGVETHDIRGEAADAFRAALEPVAEEQIASLRAAGKDVDALIQAVEDMKAAL